MANFKRKKPRRNVKCTMCTDGRTGNSKKGTGRRAKVALTTLTKAERIREAKEDIFRPEDE